MRLFEQQQLRSFLIGDFTWDAISVFDCFRLVDGVEGEACKSE